MEREGGMSVAVEYRTSVFDAARIERMIAHFVHLLGAIIEASPVDPLPSLHYMPEDQRAVVVERGAPAPRPLPEIGVHEAIAAIAAKYPQAAALEAAGRVWNYAELEAAAERMARHLLARPELAGAGARIAVCLPRSAEIVIAFLAILKAGAVYVPLDPKHPPERLQYILDDADADLVLTDGAIDLGGRPCLDPAQLNGEPPAMALPPADTQRLSYLLYTSGSTGRPKGAVITHAGLLNQLRALGREPGMAAGDRMLTVTTVAFDISILEMLLPLSVGATAVLVDQEILLSPAHLAQILEESRITHMQATPASWRMLLDHGWTGRPGLTALIGGEALDAQLAQQLLQRTYALWNLYGPTETTIWASALKVEPHHARSGKVSISGPIDNMQFLVLNAYMQPVPDGVPGELYIGGVGLGPGYWRQAALTAEKFVPNPFYDPANPSPRLYRTGDLVNRRADGEMEFIGRTDFQIKLRGYRIETGEIESLLQEEPAIAQALVMLDKEHERLITYCRLERALEETEKAALERDLRRFLAERLPRYMMPSAFVLMDAFPLNTNGKVDRKRLPSPETPHATAAVLAPRNDRERVLLTIWQEVLKREHIGVEDNFFDLGGDSVRGMQIIARAQHRGFMIDPLQLFEHQTVAAQAQIARDVAAPAAYSLSPWQRRRADTEAVPWVITLPVPVMAREKIEEGVAAVAAHHPVLGFSLDAGWKSGAPAPQLIHEPPADEADVLAWAQSVTRPSAGEALWQMRLAGTQEQPRLALAVHPLLLDALSIGWLASDLREAFARLAADAMPSFAACGDYGDWLRRQEKHAPASSAEKPGQAGSHGKVTRTLDPAATKMLVNNARHMETSVELLTLTAFAQGLAQLHGTDTAELDLVTCNRIGSGLDRHRTLGNFTRIVPLSLRLPQNSAREQLAVITEAVAEAPAAAAARNSEAMMRWSDRSGEALQWLS